MSNPKPTEREKSARREQLRVRVEQLKQSRRRSLLGLPELAGLFASALMMLAVIFAYLFFLRPAYARLDAAQLKREETYKLLQKTRENIKVNEDKQVTVSEITQSVQDFEANRLASRDEGRIALLDTLNKLIRANGLRNTSGPNYTALDPLAAGGAPGSSPSRTGNARWQSLYPGLGINVTVEGAYTNLRHFVREIETGNQFIVINSVELEKASDTAAAAAAAIPAESGEAAKPPAPRASLVSLRLDMAVYFRRTTAPETEAVPTTGKR
jgi:Tfp pilus assembly protein PilO